MDVFLVIIGVVTLVAMTIIAINIKGKGGGDGWLFFLTTLLVFGMIILSMGAYNIGVGKPKTSIRAGTYLIVGYAEVFKDKQLYYQMILEQESKARLYTLPKDMIDIAKSNEKPNVLEVVGKAGLRKAILYLPAN